MAESTKTVEFDPGIGQLATDLYLEVYIIENDMANRPQFARKARYFAATYRFDDFRSRRNYPDGSHDELFEPRYSYA